MTKVKKIIAIVSAMLLLATIIYQVNAYEGYDVGGGEPVVAVDDGVENMDEGDIYLPEVVEDSAGIASDEVTSGDAVDEIVLTDGDEAIEEVSNIGIEPRLTLPPSGPGVRRVDYTTNQEKEPQFFWTFAEDLPYLSIYIGELIPENWELSHWSVHYHIVGVGPFEPIYDTWPANNILRHVMSDEIDFETGAWLMMPTFQLFFTPIPPTLTGTVTCVTCPEDEPGLPMEGVSIHLHYVCEEEGDVVRTEITDADGFFDFGQVPFGELELVKEYETVPEGHLSIEPRSIELVTATPGGEYEEHFFVECKEPPTSTKSIIYVNDEPYEGHVVVEGDVITYRLRVHNPNPRPWSDFLVVDVLPAGLTLVGEVQVTPESALVEDNSTEAGVNVVIDLPAGPGNVDITFTAMVYDVSLAVDGVFVNVATLYGPPEEGGERPPIDDCDAEIPARPPGVSLEKLVSSPIVDPGGNLTYTLIVRNTGGAVLTNVVVTDELPVQLTDPRNLVITPAGAGTGNFVGQLLTVNIPLLGIGEEVTITFDVTVAANVAGGTAIVNVSEVTTEQNVSDEDDAVITVVVEPEEKPEEPGEKPPGQPPGPAGQAPLTGDDGILGSLMFMFVVGGTILVMMSLLKAEKRRIRKK